MPYMPCRIKIEGKAVLVEINLINDTNQQHHRSKLTGNISSKVGN